jgi:predicted TIM-barrel fold metal-dependent hydrolase
LDTPLVVVTTDAHIGPRLKEDLREYCPRQYLEEYDAFVKAVEPYSDPSKMYDMFAHTKGENPEADLAFQTSFAALQRNATAGHYDVHERLADMDRDGIAAEVVFHGSQNGQCFPFLDPAGGTFNALIFSPVGSEHDLELAAVGQHMYNQWLADQCSVQPERHAGLVYLPMWDIGAAIRELEWAYEAGLRGVNFPAPKPGIKAYDDLAWEPFWQACEERGVALSTHDGAGIDDISVARPHTLLAQMLEGDLTKKLFPRMIFGGLFERYPGVKLVLTELQRPISSWWTQTAKRYDALWETNRNRLGDQIPRPPSDYLKSNVFFGHSLLHALPSEVTAAVRDGYGPNLMWGSDYPHQEGVYRHADDDEAETRSRLGLRHAFAAAPPELAAAMIGETAAAVYGLDREKLAAVARRTNAVTLRQVATPLDTVPEEWGILIRAENVFPEYHVTGASA